MIPLSKNSIPLTIISSILLGLGLVVITTIIKFSFYELAPRSMWFEYTEIKPTKDVFGISETLQFESTSIFKRAADVEWNDILHCASDEEKVAVYFSNYNSKRLNKQPIEMIKSRWNYNSLVIQKPATCYLESNIIATINYGIKKKQTYIGQDFRIEKRLNK